MTASSTEIADLQRELRRLDDIEAIRLLKYAYCRFNDGGWPDQGPSHMGPTADLFVEDGVWDGRPVAPRSEGRGAIRQMIADYRSLAPFAIHNVFNPEIEIDGDAATGRWKALIVSTLGDGRSALGFGEYRDEYVRTPGGWRFKSLRFIQIKRASIDFDLADPVRPPDR
jgi:hypothetical protein